MAASKSKDTGVDPLVDNDSDEALDQAIGDLRGVLQTDQAGGLPDIGSFGSDLDAEFGGGSTEIGGGVDAFGGDFGAGGLDDGFKNTSNFGGMDENFGGAEFGGHIADASAAPGSALNANLDLIMDIPIDVQIILGSSRMQVSSLMNLTEGATISLDRKIGEPVDIMVNGRLIGRGEITVLDGDETRFGVKLIEIKGHSKA